MERKNKDESIRVRLDADLKKLLKENVPDISKYIRQLIINDFERFN